MHSVNQLCNGRVVSAGVKELFRSCSANSPKSNFMQWHSAGEMINGFRVSPSEGAVPSSPSSWVSGRWASPLAARCWLVAQLSPAELLAP